MKHVIIGASAAGLAAARKIRSLRPTDEIVVISTDSYVYSRCMLHKYIASERSIDELSFVSDDFFKSAGIRHLADTTVTKINCDAREVYFNDGKETYDRLLIASGAQSIFPPIDGLQDAENVFGLRHFSDARAITEKAKSAANIVIVGAGLIGLDAAYGLIGAGKKSTIIDIADSVLSSNLDSTAAERYQAEFEKAGCTFMLGTKINQVLSDSNGAVSAVVTDSGIDVPCDMLVVAVGVRPNISFIEGSGIKSDRGIVVNDYLATNVKDVFAAGDVTGLSENWPNARMQGEVAASNMCGEKTLYDDAFSLKNTVNFFNIPALSVGTHISSQSDTVICSESKSKYHKIIIRDGVVVGVILQGDISRSGYWQQLIKNKINISNINKPVCKISYADFYDVSANGEYNWVSAGSNALV